MSRLSCGECRRPMLVPPDRLCGYCWAVHKIVAAFRAKGMQTEPFRRACHPNNYKQGR